MDIGHDPKKARFSRFDKGVKKGENFLKK